VLQSKQNSDNIAGAIGNFVMGSANENYKASSIFRVPHAVKRIYTVATRASDLAVTQTQSVIAAIKHIRPDIEVTIKTVSTSGDQDTETALWKLAQTGFFTSQIETAILAGEADFAVHSFKDLPTCCSQGLVVTAVCQREYVEDALVARGAVRSLMDLPVGAKIGTSSLRRRAQLKHLRPDIETVMIRGNVGTRIRKVDEGRIDATVLARAGLQRLGLAERISAVFDPLEFLPAPGQGALAIETRTNDPGTTELISLLDDHRSRISALAERSVLAIMEGGCHAPIGVYARIDAKTMDLHGFIADVDGEPYVKRSLQGDLETWRSLAERLAKDLLESGGKEILQGLKL
jgi:hydroxymethylbilane synthase